METSPAILSERYELQELLGQGGMGAVYLAHDRLTGTRVALKQVTVPTEQIMFASRGADAGMDLALAQEFRALATIRHPNIISVYDFGFGRQGQPYYTMEYLHEGQTILDYGKDLSPKDNAELIVQMLQALVYLHRRGILHRDLKPTNALVADGRLKLLDFGLSVITERTVEHLTQTTSGTMAYLAPEIFQGEPYSRASDLYGVGLIAFQLFSGHFPYNESNLATMLFEIVSKPVDASSFGIDVRLAQVLNRLLAKEREARYQDAAAVIADLTSAVGLPAPSETTEIRESFLQAAKFVGRQEELSDLSRHLEEATNGRGSAVLIGGESGVGKSRLLDELRVRALVGGVLVLQGQAISNGRSPYQLWHDVLRALALFGKPEDEEAATLMPIVPDLGRLLNRAAPESPSPGSQVAQEQLAGTVSRLLGRLDQPALIVLEDLQWAGDESLQLLADLAQTTADRPMLLAGTYRDDEPLPGFERLAPAKTLSLRRLAEKEIAELSVSILGRARSDPELVALLLEETEGNAFFLVEAVRTLAEEAGRLDEVGEMPLPQAFVAGGVRAILNRRLDRVPEWARPLMKLASVAGRQLDLALLRALEPEADLEPWLAVLTDVSVIEALGEGWRFAHDKLREEIKELLSHEEHHDLHRRVAEGLEAVYPGAAEQAAALAFHWAVAGDPQKELYYSEIAGKLAAAQRASEEAIGFLERALELLKDGPESPERDQRELALLLDLGPQQAILRGFGYPALEYTFSRAWELAVRTGRINDLFRAIWGLWVYYAQVLDLARALDLLKQLFNLAEQSGDESLFLAAHHAAWSTESLRGNLVAAEEHIKQGLAIYDPDLHRDHEHLYGHDPGGCALSQGCIVLWLLGYPDSALCRSVEAQLLARKLGRDLARAGVAGSSGIVAYLRGDYQEAVRIGLTMLNLAADRHVSPAYGLLVQGSSFTGLGQADQGLETTRIALAEAILIRADAYRARFVAAFLEACLAAGEVDEGLEAIQNEMAEYELTGQRQFESEIRRLHGELVLARDGNAEEAAEGEFQLAIDIARRQSARSLELRAVMSLARLWQKQGKVDQARERLAAIYGWFTEGFDTADLIAAKQLLGNLT